MKYCICSDGKYYTGGIETRKVPDAPCVDMIASVSAEKRNAKTFKSASDAMNVLNKLRDRGCKNAWSLGISEYE